MPRPNDPSKSLFAFGAGVAVGFGAGIALRTGFPRLTEFAGLILEKLGFEMLDFFLLLWDPEAKANQNSFPPPRILPTKMATARVVGTKVAARRATPPKRVAKVITAKIVKAKIVSPKAAKPKTTKAAPGKRKAPAVSRREKSVLPPAARRQNRLALH